MKRPSLRDTLRANQAALDTYAALSGKPRLALYAPEPVKPRAARKPSMETPERDIKAAVLEALRAMGCRVWNNAVGQWEYAPGKWIRYGLGNPGGSDLIGYRVVRITPSMVGMKIPVFLAVETKRKGKNAEEHQERFMQAIREDGGIAFTARGVDDVTGALKSEPMIRVNVDELLRNVPK